VCVCARVVRVCACAGVRVRLHEATERRLWGNQWRLCSLALRPFGIKRMRASGKGPHGSVCAAAAVPASPKPVQKIGVSRRCRAGTKVVTRFCRNRVLVDERRLQRKGAPARGSRPQTHRDTLGRQSTDDIRCSTDAGWLVASSGCSSAGALVRPEHTGGSLPPPRSVKDGAVGGTYLGVSVWIEAGEPPKTSKGPQPWGGRGAKRIATAI